MPTEANSDAVREVPAPYRGISYSSKRVCGVALLWLLASTALANTNEFRYWPQWRGPLANGVAPMANPPAEWSEKKNVRWKVELPGKGHSSPIVFGDRVYVMAAAPVGAAQKPVHDSAPGVHDSVPVTHTNQYFVMALSRSDGRTLWKKVVREEWPHEGGHDTGSPVSNSPTTDGQFVYALFGSRGLYCLDTNSAVKWQKDLGRMQTHHAHGEGSSPVLHGDTLVVNWDHEGDSFLYAFDKRSGRQLWKTPREEKTTWATPLIVEVDGKPQVVVSATRRLRGTLYNVGHIQNVFARRDPATGNLKGELLRLDGIRDFIFSSPVGAANRIYITGRDGATVVLRHDEENATLAVNHLDDSFSASAALVDNEMYLRGERFLYCIAEK